MVRPHCSIFYTIKERLSSGVVQYETGDHKKGGTLVVRIFPSSRRFKTCFASAEFFGNNLESVALISYLVSSELSVEQVSDE